MAEFTKGPWAVDGPPWNQIVWSGADNRVCFLAHSDGLDDRRDIATGRLIAAAPDMFEALKEARKITLETAEITGLYRPALIAQIDAALSRATGG